MAKLILSTGNIVASGPSVVHGPRTAGSNSELIDSLRTSFSAAQLDDSPAPSPTERQYAIASTDSSATWTSLEGDAVMVPRVEWPQGPALQEQRTQYDITVKLFLFRGGKGAVVPADHAHEALALVARALGIVPPLPVADLLIASFPGLLLEGDCAWAADTRNAAQGDPDAELAFWPALETTVREGTVRRLGVADFGSARLAAFLAGATVPPAVDQLNLRHCCKVPPPLVELAHRKSIELLVHTDPPDVLPESVLNELLSPGPRGSGVLTERRQTRSLDTVGQANVATGLVGRAVPLWVVRYTAVVRNRGVIENKGYFVGVKVV